MKKNKEKKTNRSRTIAVILFICIFSVYAISQLSGGMSSISEWRTGLSAPDTVKEFDRKAVTIANKGSCELTEDMVPEGYTLDYYENPIYYDANDVVSATYVNNGVSTEISNDNMQQQSDVKGMTWQDKIDKGMLPVEGADSDHDGLTDKDEIEVYNSDPLKKSTAGDLYSDGYKIENGMDIAMQYDFEGEQEFKNNLCPAEISLSAVIVDDFSGTVKNVTGRDRLSDDVLLYAEYEVYNFSGKLTIDLSQIKGGIEPDIVSLIYSTNDNNSTEYCEFFVDENNPSCIIPDLQYDFYTHYYIFVVDKASTSKVQGMLDNIPDVNGIISEKIGTATGGNMLIYGSPLICIFGGKMKILVADGSEDVVNLEKQVMIAENNALYDGFDDALIKSVDDEHIKTEQGLKISAKKEMFDSILPWSEYNDRATDFSSENKMNLLKMVFTYKYVQLEAKSEDISEPEPLVEEAENEAPDEGADTDKRKEEIKKEGIAPEPDIPENNEPILSSSGFDVSKDGFCFKNFHTYIGKTGNCAGIAWYSALLYNTKQVVTNGSFNYLNFSRIETGEAVILDTGDKSWDITAHPENSTLIDEVIFDYRDENFLQNKTTHSFDTYAVVNGKIGDKTGTTTFDIVDYDSLSEPDKNFVDMMGQYFTELNAENIKCEKAQKGTSEYSFSTIQNIMDRIDNGLVSIVGVERYVSGSYFTGHAVVAYAYEYTESAPDHIKLMVYDSNYPGVDDFCYFDINKETSALTGEDTFSYTYNPCKEMTSNVPTGQEYKFTAFDEGLNRL